MRSYSFGDDMPCETEPVAVQAEPAEPTDDADVEDIYLELGVGD